MSVDQKDVKEEQEGYFTNQEKQQLHRLEASETIELPFNTVPVKIENDEEKPQLSPMTQISGFNSMENSDASVSNSRCNITRKQFNCVKCGKAFGQMDYAKQHERIHASVTTFYCVDCDKKLRQKGNLNIRIRSQTGKNESKKMIGCSGCGKKSGEKSKFNTDKRIHEGERPLQCCDCSERFGQDNLNTDTRRYTEKKPFGCSECDKKFEEKGRLYRHMKIHTGEKPFGCFQCGKRFGQTNHLKMHMRIHTGEKLFECSECDKRFGQKGDLNRHMRIHTGEKPFGCSECDERFGRKSCLNTHMIIHTGHKQFVCAECGKDLEKNPALKDTSEFIQERSHLAVLSVAKHLEKKAICTNT
ncbi:gastrula zinc finger protein XlCGF8.2DB-like isoform X2 [Thalassophryne amazonica]|uniref:gastrula zinc finger protein XlCGF8.2DB-like isoform X2 n=1 Tax=Thalassophryne amazonica TaxID=390379 RepID=UPI0014723385|nr:gastrula zinc finger protein XlCGF8.2DB-like isoform X2 [Thalassophryne amazonica]XP_034038844.1 gastrula zinc finger protein XlCGF8.2DB-like isoform X2 [Thalassophryne amazonica]